MVIMVSLGDIIAVALLAIVAVAWSLIMAREWWVRRGRAKRYLAGVKAGKEDGVRERI